jgi:hypothetical protein
MEETIVPAAPPVCRSCGNDVKESDTFCQICGFPLKAPREEQDQFIYDRDHKQLELRELKKKIKRAGTTLYVIAGLNLLLGLILYTVAPDSELAIAVLLTNLVVGGVFLGLAVWSKQKPVPALISALSLYILLQLILIAADPENIIRGIIIKAVIIVFLIRGLQSALDAEKIKKEHNLS